MTIRKLAGRQHSSVVVEKLPASLEGNTAPGEGIAAYYENNDPAHSIDTERGKRLLKNAMVRHAESLTKGGHRILRKSVPGQLVDCTEGGTKESDTSQRSFRQTGDDCPRAPESFQPRYRQVPLDDISSGASSTQEATVSPDNDFSQSPNEDSEMLPHSGFMEITQAQQSPLLADPLQQTNDNPYLGSQSLVDVEENEKISKTIHILGTRPEGLFLAFSLARSSLAPPVTLLLHRTQLMQEWYDEGCTIKLLVDGDIIEQTGITVESTVESKEECSGPRASGDFRESPDNAAGENDTIIDNLIVTTEGHATLAALASIKHRLRNWSTVCFLQKGLGIVERINSLLFQDPVTRPKYIIGSITYQVHPTEKTFTVLQRSEGTLNLSMTMDGAPTRSLYSRWPKTSKYLLRTLSEDTRIFARGLREDSFLKVQLENIAINSVIGPVSVLFDCRNDQLLYNYQASQTMRLLLEEICLVLRSLPEFHSTPNIASHFSVARFESIMLSAISGTRKNNTDMLRNVRAGRQTDIDYHNGYILKRAEELGLACPLNEMIVLMVKAKQRIRANEIKALIPFRRHKSPTVKQWTGEENM